MFSFPIPDPSFLSVILLYCPTLLQHHLTYIIRLLSHLNTVPATLILELTLVATAPCNCRGHDGTCGDCKCCTIGFYHCFHHRSLTKDLFSTNCLVWYNSLAYGYLDMRYGYLSQTMDSYICHHTEWRLNCLLINKLSSEVSGVESTRLLGIDWTASTIVMLHLHNYHILHKDKEIRNVNVPATTSFSK